jgi:hypothetical protein
MTLNSANKIAKRYSYTNLNKNGPTFMNYNCVFLIWPSIQPSVDGSEYKSIECLTAYKKI